MKKKIVIKVQMKCDRCRVKAMQVVAAAGADSVAVEGEEKDQLVVVGDCVDPANLTTTLRKKVGHACIVKVEEAKKKESVAWCCPGYPLRHKVEAAKESARWCYPPCQKVVMYDHEIYASDPGGCSIL
ncbi:heavy metal-associated isoprenylated plant protein 47-like [Musa acuminata AAA Group]|uniref:heavy metal-associated isoprenylated plant protein 47-like n=1 Tax=Musa acuminata AAA Group TaxID=214697 RepID=UPI0031D018DE